MKNTDLLDVVVAEDVAQQGGESSRRVAASFPHLCLRIDTWHIRVAFGVSKFLIIADVLTVLPQRYANIWSQ